MSEQREMPFEYLKRVDGTSYDAETIANWYIARAYVLEKLQDVAFEPGTREHLHVVVLGDNARMLSVVRQVALSAHFINYDDEEPVESWRNRTVITIVSQNPNIKEILEKEEYLCNLPKYCKYVAEGSEPQNVDSYVDIQLQIVKEYSQYKDNDKKKRIIINRDDVNAFFDKSKDDKTILSIDTRKAAFTDRMYSLGILIDNLPAEDIHSAKRYALALNVFQYDKLKKKAEKMFDDDGCNNIITVKERLSNVFCADCFESRAKSIQLCKKDDDEKEWVLWAKHNVALSKSEHARWVAEKLIMGYSPLSNEQRFIDESLFYDKNRRIRYRKSLKKEPKHPAHIDLCSYRTLRRVNPDDMKFDSFLMLAIPKILKRCLS